MWFDFWASQKTQEPPVCNLLGLDGVGKTTLLYMWHRGQVVVTIPTNGINVEEIHHSGRNMVVWDYGGGYKLRELVESWIKPTAGLLFLHALNCDAERTEDSIALLKLHIEQSIKKNGRYIWIMVTQQDRVPLEDLESKRVACRRLLTDVLSVYNSQIVWKIFDDEGLTATEASKVWPIFDDIARVLNSQNHIPQIVLTNQTYDEEQTRAKIQEEQVDDQPTQEFWQQILTADLPQWNHRNFLYAGYLVLLKPATVSEDFWTATDILLGHIERWRQAKPDRLIYTPHRTAIVFWLYMLKLCIASFLTTSGRLPRENEFQTFIFKYPRLYDMSYLSDYYNKTTLFTPEARQDWCLPDKKALPIDVESRTNDEANTNETWQYCITFTHLIKVSETDSGAQIHFIRFAISVVQHFLSSGEHREKAIATGLTQLQKSLLTLRGSQFRPLTTIPPYSETQAYFWIQIVHATLAPYKQRYMYSAVSLDVEAPRPSHQAFRTTFTLTHTQLVHTFTMYLTLWKRYYTAKVWNSIEARKSFVAPDLRQLPNVFPVSSSATVSVIDRITQSTAYPKAQPNVDSFKDDTAVEIDESRVTEKTAMQVDEIVAAAHRLGLMEENKEIGDEDYVVIEYDQPAEMTPLDALTSLLFTLHQALRESTNPSSNEIDESNFVSLVLSYDSRRPSGQNYIALPTESHANADDRSVLDFADLPEEKKSNLTRMGRTQLMFYARMTLAMNIQQDTKTKNKLNTEEPGSSDMLCESKFESTSLRANEFRTFLASRSALIWEDLPFRYYSPETWNSPKAKTMVVAPDLRALP